jgi:hypothetical protein
MFVSFGSRKGVPTAIIGATMAATALSFMGAPFCNSITPAKDRRKLLGAL